MKARHQVKYRIYIDDDTATINYIDCEEDELAKHIMILQKAGQIIKSVERILLANKNNNE